MMKKYLYSRFLAKRFRAAREVNALLSRVTTRKDIESFQVARFNEVWRDAWSHIPFYREWKNKYSLPEEISCLEELSCWPILTKVDLINLDPLIRSDAPMPADHIMTGGSTGTPVRLPIWPNPETVLSLAVGRSWYDIGPIERTFLLWGHLHLYGKGVRRCVNIVKRRLKDWLAGWRRVSAYDLSREAMERAYREFASFKPSFVIGYSPSILTFCRINQRHVGQVRSVKTVLCSAGPLSPDEKAEIETFFDARVCMEYGSVECGVMAYTHPSDGKYRVFWNTHLLQVVKDKCGEYRNIVTLLSKKYIPLIRYDIGDFLLLGPEELKRTESILHVDDVLGRPSEFLNFKCGVSFFAWAVGDCVKQCAKVINHQIVVNENNDSLTLKLVTKTPLNKEDERLIRDKISTIVSGCEKLKIEFVEVSAIPTAPSGKIIRVVRQ